MTVPSSATDLLAIAAAAARDVPPGAACGLVAADEVALASHSPAEIARRALAGDEWHDSGRSYILAGGDLKSMLLVARGGPGRASRLWIFDGWSLVAVHGAGADLRGARLRGAQLHGAQLRGALFDDADLAGADLAKSDLSDACLAGASLAGASLFCASLLRADLTEADMARADLRHVDLRGARCIRTAFRCADLWGAYLWDVDLSRAFAAGADLDRADYLNEVIARNGVAPACEPANG